MPQASHLAFKVCFSRLQLPVTAAQSNVVSISLKSGVLFPSFLRTWKEFKK